MPNLLDVVKMKLGEWFFIGIIHAFTNMDQSLSQINMDLAFARNEAEKPHALQVSRCDRVSCLQA